MERIRRLAADQQSLITREQALAAGASSSWIKRRTAAGEWKSVLPGVYRFTSAPRSWIQRFKAATLWAGSGSVLSHASAARVWKLDGVHTSDSQVVEVTVAAPRVLRDRPGVRVHTTRILPSKDCGICLRLPVTSLPRTVIDLAPRLSDRMLERAVEDVIRRRDNNFSYLCDRLNALIVGRPGASRVRVILREHEEQCIKDYNAFETYVRQLLKEHGLPIGLQGHDIFDGDKWVANADFAYLEAQVAVQADGYFAHGRKKRFHIDRDQWNDFAEADWQVIHVTWQHVQSNDANIARQLRRLLQSRAPQLLRP